MMEDIEIVKSLLNGNHLKPLEIERGFRIVDRLKIALGSRI